MFPSASPPVWSQSSDSAVPVAAASTIPVLPLDASKTANEGDNEKKMESCKFVVGMQQQDSDSSSEEEIDSKLICFPLNPETL